MTDPHQDLLARLARLGLHCDQLPLGELSSATVALACFPMYMVANVHAWTPERQWEVPLVNLPGAESLREAWAIGRQESALQDEDHVPMSRDHRRVLGSLLSGAKAADRVIYEYALETLGLYLEMADPPIADHVRTAVARMVVAVAQASGKGWFGTGEAVSAEERTCIEQIDGALNLRRSPAAAQILDSL